MDDDAPGAAGGSPPPWSPVASRSLPDAAAGPVRPPWLGDVEAIVGPRFVLSSLPDRWAYARDRSPYAVFHVRNATVPATLPAAIACPGTVDELAALLVHARAHSIPVIPFGGGSGVLGGTLPIAQELVLDLKRLNRILDLNETDCTVTVQAGMNGGQFEDALNARGFTSGHLPQSLTMSTVGGWAACRSAGQNSTRYGKIEDMLLGLEVVLPDGGRLRVRPNARHAAGPELGGIFVGSEGVLGIISELTLRIWRLPDTRLGLVVAFPAVTAGLDALRTIMQRELRPAVVRLYDETESLPRTRSRPPFDANPYLAFFEFSGMTAMAGLERDLAAAICRDFGAVETDDAIYQEWLPHRFGSLSTAWHAADHYMDTMETVAAWSVLPELYAASRDAVRDLCPDFHFGTHWSHVYPEGACQYTTLRLPPMSEERALHLLRSAWDRLQRLCLDAGGSIAHHHGIGLFRNPWLRAELGDKGFELLRHLKQQLDPGGLLLPGKLGLRPPAPGQDGEGL